MEMGPLFSSVAMMAAIIGIGAAVARKVPLTDDNRQLMIVLIVNVAMPCIILNGIFQTPIDETLLAQIFLIFFLSVLLNCIGIGMGWLAAKAVRTPRRKACEMAIVSGLGNTGFIGLPLCAALFGPKGALLAAVFDAGLDFTLWTVGVMLLQERRSFSLSSMKALINIPMVAIVGGMVIALVGWQPPETVKTLTSTLAQLASPLAMLYIGMLIPSLLKVRKPFPLPVIGLPITVKLCLFPLAVCLMLSFITPPLDVTRVVMVQVTMPSLTLASILFARYAADEQMGAMATVCSTLIGLLTIPLMVLVGEEILRL
ncbi:MAG: AEC family transporter [Brevibacillus sp.]|nr:AEC family transporter [Brevibacillus sp.]